MVSIILLFKSATFFFLALSAILTVIPICVGNSRTRVLHEPYAAMYSSNKLLVGVNAYLFAVYQDIIAEAQLFEFLLDADNLRESMETVTAVATTFSLLIVIFIIKPDNDINKLLAVFFKLCFANT